MLSEIFAQSFKENLYVKGEITQKKLLFESLIKYNRIHLVNDSNFTNLYNDEKILWRLILHSIKLDKYEFVNLLLGKSEIKLCNFHSVIELYKEVTILFRK